MILTVAAKIIVWLWLIFKVPAVRILYNHRDNPVGFKFWQSAPGIIFTLAYTYLIFFAL